MTLDLAYPFTGRWLVRNSPASRIPSHGTNLFATTHAIDFIPLYRGRRSAPFLLSSLFQPESPERFPGFGRPILAPITGTIVGYHDGAPDHAAYRGLPSVWYSLNQRRRIARGWVRLAGNHVFIESGSDVVALCHLQRGSVCVEAGDQVEVGQEIGRCGNSGNSTEPHLHLQVMDRAQVTAARAVPISFGGRLPGNGEVVGS